MKLKKKKKKKKFFFFFFFFFFDFFNFFFFFEKKKSRVGPEIFGSVGEPETQLFFFWPKGKNIRDGPSKLFTIRPEFFYFSFYRPSRPNFLEIEKKIKEIFFNFIFLFPSDSCSLAMFFRFVFSIAARLIKLPPVTALGKILPF